MAESNFLNQYLHRLEYHVSLSEKIIANFAALREA